MKILYVKNNSERAKKFQLKTIIFEEDGKKFVRKQTLSDEALPHLKKMKDSYRKLTAAIINPKIKLAKIVSESDDGLTFEFIDGISLEKKYHDALKFGENESRIVINEYMDLLATGFKTTLFKSSSMVTDEYKRIFGNHDYSEFDDKICFDGISNIDLIFSNIIFKDDHVYLIDYEWVFELNLPIDYAAFRTLPINDKLHEKMENNFRDEIVVNKTGFFKIQHNYLNNRLNILQLLHEKDQQIQHLHDVAQSLRFKNRLKRLIKIFK